MRLALLAITASATLSAAGAAAAATMITSGSYSLSDSSFGSGLGVHSDGAQLNTHTVNGHVNLDGSAVTFTSTNLLSDTGAGEATIGGPFDNLNVAFAKGWNAITFNFERFPKETTNFSLTVNGSTVFSGCSICVIGAGANKFTVSGPGITNLAFSFDDAIKDAKQFRVAGSIPEPEAWGLMLFGLFGTGALLRARRRTAAA